MTKEKLREITEDIKASTSPDSIAINEMKLKKTLWERTE